MYTHTQIYPRAVEELAYANFSKNMGCSYKHGCAILKLIFIVIFECLLQALFERGD